MRPWNPERWAAAQKELRDMSTTPEYDAILARKMREREEGNKGPEIKMNLVAHIEQTPEIVGYVTKSGRVYKSKPGRKPKVK